MMPVFPSVSRSGRGVRLGAAAALTALATAGCAIDLSQFRAEEDGGETESPEPVDAAPLVEEALDDLAEWPALRAQGQTAGPEGSPRETTLTVTDAGTARGTVQVADSEVTLMSVDERLFLSADDTYWLGRDEFNVDSGSYADNWVRVTPESLGIAPRATFTPAALAEALREHVPEQGEVSATETDLDGTTAYRVELGENRLWVAAEQPHRLLRAQLTELAPVEGKGPTSRVDLEVAPPDSEAIASLYDDLSATVEEELPAARDARIQIDWDGELDMECETGAACTVTGTAADTTDGDAKGSTMARMDVTFTNEELGEKSCVDSVELKAGTSVELSCGVDYELSPSTDPQTYEIDSEARLSTRAVTNAIVEDSVTKLADQRETTLAKAEEDASPDGGSPESDADADRG